jgi:hypothetical protein
VALPAIEAAGNTLNLYYSPRDGRGRAHIARARLEVSGEGALRVVRHDPDPVLSPGELGAFDDAGVSVSCVVEGDAGQGTLLYYTGWALGVSVPFYFYAGLAVRRPGGPRFERVSRAPLLERDSVDPYLTASPWVLREADGLWRMWYVSCARWEMVEDTSGLTKDTSGLTVEDTSGLTALGPEPSRREPSPRHYYHVRYAESDDGVHWRREGRVAVDFKDAEEYAMGRPCVVREGDRYRMWFCARGESYRLAYAESSDGLSWRREDERVELAGPAGEWESQMQAYPAVFARGGRRYLLYNGNGYGRGGVGYAVSAEGSD